MYVSPITDALINILSDVCTTAHDEFQPYTRRFKPQCPSQKTNSLRLREYKLRLCRMKNSANCMIPMKKHYHYVELLVFHM